ncbi:unnamed protein product [Urochloa humidicola]
MYHGLDQLRVFWFFVPRWHQVFLLKLKIQCECIWLCSFQVEDQILRCCTPAMARATASLQHHPTASLQDHCKLQRTCSTKYHKGVVSEALLAQLHLIIVHLDGHCHFETSKARRGR